MAMTGGQRRLEQAFPGRFVLGLGVSHEFIVEGVRGQSEFARPFARMSAYLDDMDGARSAAALMDKVAEEGLVALTGFEPGELPDRPPRLLAALGPRMLALSAEKADGPLLYFQTPEHTKEVRASLGPEACIVTVQMVVMEDDPADARAAARRMLDLYSFLPSFVTHFERQGFSADEFDDGGSNRLIDGIFARGDAELAAQRVRDQLSAGADHVAVQVILPTWPHGVPLRQWRELAGALAGTL
jgi:probable F420-dependent oxidoreductase